jgi:uncharacterized membrane protein
MNLDKKLVAAVILMAGFVFAVSLSTLYAQTHIIEGTACSCTLPIPLLIPTFSSLGLFIGSIVYYLTFSKVEEARERCATNARVLLDMLEPNEKNIILKIVDNKGKITQSKLSRQFGKVKTFRVLENLRKRGIIKKESYGKTNLIELDEKYSKLLLSS